MQKEKNFNNNNNKINRIIQKERKKKRNLISIKFIFLIIYINTAKISIFF